MSSSKLLGFKERLIRRQSEIVWVVFAQILTFSGSLAAVKVLTSLLSTAAYGEFSLALTIAGGVNMFVFGPLSQAGMRYSSIATETGNTLTFLRTVNRLSWEGAAFVLVIGLGAMALLVLIEDSIHWSGWAISAIGFGIASGLLSIPIALFTAQRKRRLVAYLQGGDAWARVGFALMCIFFLGETAFAAVLGYFAGSTLFFFLAAQRLSVARQYDVCIRSESDEVIALRRKLLAFAYPFLGFSLFALIAQYGDRWLLQQSRGADDVGVYAVLLQTATIPITLLYTFMSNITAPIVFARVGHDPTGARLASVGTLLVRVSLTYIVLVTLGGSVIWEFGDSLVSLVSNANYVGHTEILLILYAAAACFMLGQYWALIGLANNQPGKLLVPKLLQALILLVLGAILVPTLGMTGVAWATLAAAVVHSIVIFHGGYVALRRSV